MKNYFNRVPEITKLLLRGNDSYEEFILDGIAKEIHADYIKFKY